MRTFSSSPTGIQPQLPCFCLPFLLAGSQMQLIVSGSNACRLVQSYQLLAAFFSNFWLHLVVVVTSNRNIARPRNTCDGWMDG